MPRPLVPRELRFGVPGRTLADGSTLPGHDLDEEYVERLARELADAGIEAVAIAFLNSFANPSWSDARGSGAIAPRRDIRVSISSDVAPEIASTSAPRRPWPMSTSRPGSSATCATWRSGWRGPDSLARCCC